MTYPRYVENIIERLENAGETAYIVGGSLRDMLLGTEPHDYDVTTSALPETTTKIFGDMRVIQTGIKHGTVTVISDSHPIEVTTFRIDGDYTDSRHPDKVSFTDDVTADLARRDFTVNAMAYSNSRGLKDPFGGRDDLKRRILRAVGDAEARFTEDALRIMRLFRFCAQLGFDIESSTLDGAYRKRAGLSKVARERIGHEFERLVTSPSPTRALSLMRDGGIFEYILGNYVPADKIIERISLMPADNYARLGFLLSEADTDSARTLLRELRCSGKLTTGAFAVIKGSKTSVCSASDARRLIADTGIYAYAAAFASELLGNSPAGAAELTRKQQNTPCSLKDLKINGKNLADMAVRGKRIGEVLDTLLRHVIDTPEDNKREILLRLVAEIIEREGNDDGRA